MNGGAEDRAALVDERRDLLNAIQAIRDAMHLINEALEQLAHAHDIVTVESWGGWLWASSIKRNALARAAASMRAVDVALSEVRERLRDIGIEDTASLVAGPAPGALKRDPWLDVLLMDRHTRRQVRKATERLDILARVLVRVRSMVNRRERDLSERIEAAQA
jgi:predicted P-loop ATPase/GTPase